MTWTQVKTLDVELRLIDINDAILAHESNTTPLKPRHMVARLGRSLFASRARLLAARQVEDHHAGRGGGMTLGQLEGALGEIPRRYRLPDGSFIGKDEWDKMTVEEQRALRAAAEERAAGKATDDGGHSSQ